MSPSSQPSQPSQPSKPAEQASQASRASHASQAGQLSRPAKPAKPAKPGKLRLKPEHMKNKSLGREHAGIIWHHLQLSTRPSLTKAMRKRFATCATWGGAALPLQAEEVAAKLEEGGDDKCRPAPDKRVSEDSA